MVKIENDQQLHVLKIKSTCTLHRVETSMTRRYYNKICILTVHVIHLLIHPCNQITDN